jgi:tyrosyl-tRNA synthetase
MNTRLGASHAALLETLRTSPDLRDESAFAGVLDLLAERRTLDLADLPPGDQAALIAARAAEILPSTARLTDLLETAGRPLVVKFGIDPTAADVHVGHAVPMMIASRFQRMGHRVVFIVGDLTAKIGDPSGSSGERPALSDAEIAHNMATYRDQVSPFVDFDRADLRCNSAWLSGVTLPEFLGVLTRLPVSSALQRDDFRGRLASGGGLTMAELVYSVVMAFDSVEVVADVEIGGLDQLLNLQMCRRVMQHAGLTPEVVVASGLIEGTDGSGAKMSKSKRNYVGLGSPPGEVFGKLMSTTDRLMPEYLRALTELLDPEIERLLNSLTPMRLKALLAADVTAAIHGRARAESARSSFAARFSRRALSEATDLPIVDLGECGQSTVVELFTDVTALVTSRKQVRRVAAGGGLRLVVEVPGELPRMTRLPDADARVADVVGPEPVTVVGPEAVGPGPDARTFLKCGRAVVEVRRPTTAART